MPHWSLVLKTAQFQEIRKSTVKESRIRGLIMSDVMGGQRPKHEHSFGGNWGRAITSNQPCAVPEQYVPIQYRTSAHIPPDIPSWMCHRFAMVQIAVYAIARLQVKENRYIARLQGTEPSHHPRGALMPTQWIHKASTTGSGGISRGFCVTTTREICV